MYGNGERKHHGAECNNGKRSSSEQCYGLFECG
jgi:hypothetical protein